MATSTVPPSKSFEATLCGVRTQFVLTAYAYCELKCRSNTLSTLHENTFRSSYHYCFGESVYAHGIPLSRFEMGLRLKGLIAE